MILIILLRILGVGRREGNLNCLPVFRRGALPDGPIARVWGKVALIEIEEEGGLGHLLQW